MLSSVMLRLIALIKVQVLEDRMATIIRVTRIGQIGSLAVTSNRRC
jgi:hypothetical protein